MDINVRIPLTPQYLAKSVTIDETTIDLTIPLVDGTHRLTTDLVPIGTMKHLEGVALMASVTLWYSYDSADEIVTFCSNDLVSPDAMFVTTVPSGSSQVGHQHTYDGDDQPCGINLDWNYCTPLTPGLQTALQETVRKANDLIIDEARKLDLMVVVRTPLPVLTAEEYEQFSVVYYKDKFLELYDPDKVYDDNHTIYGLGSYFDGVATFKKHQNFANVIGSTNDPRPKGMPGNASWIKLWEATANDPNYPGNKPPLKPPNPRAATCASLNFGPKSGAPAHSQSLIACNTSIVGGHVILGQDAGTPKKATDKLYIIPICKSHNSKKGDKVYMQPIMYDRVVQLSNFMKMPAPDEG